MRDAISPLDFASMMGLADEVQRLSKFGLHSNRSSLLNGERGFFYTSLHLALFSRHRNGFTISKKKRNAFITNDSSDSKGVDETWHSKQALPVVEILLGAGADVNEQLVVSLYIGWDLYYGIMTPLVLAVVCNVWRAACVLLDAGAK